MSLLLPFLNAVSDAPHAIPRGGSSPEKSDSDCWSSTSCISHEADCDSKETSSEQGKGSDQPEVLEYRDDDKWMPIQPSAIPNVLYNGDSLMDTGWRPIIEYRRYFLARLAVQEKSLDALTVLAETVSGALREYVMLLMREKYHLMVEYGVPLQSLLILIKAVNGAWTDTDWWRFHHLYIPSQGIYHCSFSSSTLDGRLLFDYATDRPWKDLVEVMRMALPRFQEMNVRRETLSKRGRMGGFSNSSYSAGETNMTNIVACLDIAESVSKLVPVVGNVLEGACGVLRKIIQAAEGAGATRDVCKAIAEHTACITLAIVNEIGLGPSRNSAPVKRICDLWATINEVERKITALSSLGKMQYFVSRGKINTEVMALRQKVDNARVAFEIRNDISMTRLLNDLRTMHTCLLARVDDLFEGQKTTHDMLHMLLVEVRGRKARGARVEEAD